MWLTLNLTSDVSPFPSPLIGTTSCPYSWQVALIIAIGPASRKIHM